MLSRRQPLCNNCEGRAWSFKRKALTERTRTAITLLTQNQIISSIFYPFNHQSHEPLNSSNGKYVLRLNFNGCFRKVIIDDRLPSSSTSQSLHVVDRNNPGLLWPAIIEKAYLKIRGGYDFPGSNSGTDLWVLTSWIPEQLFLQRYELHSSLIIQIVEFDFGF